MLSRLVATDRALSAACAASIVADGPESTHSPGALSAARHTPSSTKSLTSATEAITASIDPGGSEEII